MTYICGLLFGSVVTVIFLYNKEIHILQEEIDKLQSRQNIHEDRLKSLFYHIKDKDNITGK